MTLIVRHHTAGGRVSEAVYSPCERYRYALTRRWSEDSPRLLYIMLNPSTATEVSNDPTIERCERRARHLGYGAFRVANLFALRETSPIRLRQARHPVGPDNLEEIAKALDWTDDVLCAWGIHGANQGQDAVTSGLLSECGKPVLALGVSKDGHPRHPLYLPYAARPVPWSAG